MLISELMENIRSDFRTLGELGGPDTQAIAERLGAALEPAFQKHFLDSLNELIQEFNLGDSSPLVLNLEGDEIHLSRLVPAGADVPTSTPQDLSARIALRLSDELKENIENLATDVGSSVNTWIVRNLERSVRGDTPGPSFKSRNQLRGRGRA
ncbi:MAG TPA: hypothetical protein VMF33_05455 [Acidimicrobiales bacterium]|nr:hypothetical protein [Acidimicrobiales bacterium]